MKLTLALSSRPPCGWATQDVADASALPAPLPHWHLTCDSAAFFYILACPGS